MRCRSLLTDPDNGLWKKLDNLLAGMTDSTHGALTMEAQTLQDRHDLFSKRIDDMNALLDIKQQQLYSQFQAMETALAQLQGQQSVLTTLALDGVVDEVVIVVVVATGLDWRRPLRISGRSRKQ